MVVRNWSFLFALVAVLSVAAFLYAPFSPDWWLPNPHSAPGHSVSSMGREIDLLFIVILLITGLVFIGTQVALVWEAFTFVDQLDEQGKPKRAASYFHGDNRLEIVWTLVPAVILVFITIYQFGTWARIKYPSRNPKVPPLAEITARQFQWVMRYPGPDGRLHSPDDLILINDLHFVKNQPTLIHLKSSDVIHSFFLPQFRLKQDAVPGLTIPVWFDSDTAGSFELACAELCGWGHYKMRGNVTVHETEAEFAKWTSERIGEQNRDQLDLATDGEAR